MRGLAKAAIYYSVGIPLVICVCVSAVCANLSGRALAKLNAWYGGPER